MTSGIIFISIQAGKLSPASLVPILLFLSFPPRDDIGLVSCDEISKYGIGKSGMKGLESPSYFLEQESGKYYTLMEGEDHPVSSEYERGRVTGVRRREKTPTHGMLAGSGLSESFSLCHLCSIGKCLGLQLFQPT